jgi:hypothetical protein
LWGLFEFPENEKDTVAIKSATVRVSKIELSQTSSNRTRTATLSPTGLKIEGANGATKASIAFGMGDDLARIPLKFFKPRARIHSLTNATTQIKGKATSDGFLVMHSGGSNPAKSVVVSLDGDHVQRMFEKENLYEGLCCPVPKGTDWTIDVYQNQASNLRGGELYVDWFALE